MNAENFWEVFYKKNYLEGSRKALWDVSTALSVEKDFEKFDRYFFKDLPVLDIGCGTGEQALFLSRHYSKVIGVDISETAIQLASKNHTAENLHFQTLDFTDTFVCRDLWSRYGDMNLYMRGVLHQIHSAQQPLFIDNLSALMGKTGCLYFIEVADNIRDYFAAVSGGFRDLPKALQEVFVSNLPPNGLNAETLTKLFPPAGFTVLDSGNDFLNTNLTTSQGEVIQIPAVYGLVRNLSQ